MDFELLLETPMRINLKVFGRRDVKVEEIRNLKEDLLCLSNMKSLPFPNSAMNFPVVKEDCPYAP